MFQALWLIIAMSATAPDLAPTVQSKNGEFIFNQYPPRAKAAGEQGSVRFRAEVDAKGNVLSCKVIESSGFERLDHETCALIVDHASFKPTLDSDGKERAAIHDGIVNWKLPGIAAQPTKVASIGGKPLDEVVCKRSAKTGSLIAATRVCMTRREWIQAAENAQEDYGALQGRRGFTVCPIDPVTKVQLC